MKIGRRKSKIKEAVNKALMGYYKKGLTNTAAALRKHIFKQIAKQ